ncbi:MAG: hypothetical protein ABDH21_02505 [bacterium]
MNRCIVCLEIFEGNKCYNCQNSYDFSNPENTPFFNQLLTLVNKNKIDEAIIAVKNWIEEIQITIKSSKTKNFILPKIESQVQIINDKLNQIIEKLTKIEHKLSQNEKVEEDLKEIGQLEVEVFELVKNLTNIKQSLEDHEYIYQEIKNSGFEIEYIIEKIVDQSKSE